MGSGGEKCGWRKDRKWKAETLLFHPDLFAEIAQSVCSIAYCFKNTTYFYITLTPAVGIYKIYD